MQRSGVERSLVSQKLGGLRLAQLSYHAGLRQPKHAHAHSTITLIVRGALEEQGPTTQHSASPWSVVIKPAGTQHADVFGPAGVRTLQVSVPSEVLERKPYWIDVFANYGWHESGRVAACFARLYCVLAGGELAADLAVEESLCHVADAIGVKRGGEPRQHRPDWLARVVEQLLDLNGEPPSVAELAAEARVHPVYLARAFRRHYRSTMSQFVRRERVARACRRIATTAEPLAVVALETGFADQPHLCRVFRGEMGLTPAAYRRLMQG